VIYQISLPYLHPTTSRRWYDGHNIVRSKHVATRSFHPLHLFFIRLDGMTPLPDISFRVFFRTRRMYDHVLGGDGSTPVSIPVKCFALGGPPIQLHGDGFCTGDLIEFRFEYLGTPGEHAPVSMQAVFSDGVPDGYYDTMTRWRDAISPARWKETDRAWMEKQRAGNATLRADPMNKVIADFEPPYEEPTP
jgi:hypothetical protein